MTNVRQIAVLLQQIRLDLTTSPIVLDENNVRRDIKEIRADRGHLILVLEPLSSWRA